MRLFEGSILLALDSAVVECGTTPLWHKGLLERRFLLLVSGQIMYDKAKGLSQGLFFEFAVKPYWNDNTLSVSKAFSK